MYDAIVVGARCAGSATAMLLARRGHRVLLVDKAGFPSDTLSTHYIHQAGVASLSRWGLLDRLAATGCPPIGRQVFDAGPVVLEGLPAPAPADGAAVGYAPRRTVLDKLLLDAAAEAGVEVRERFLVRDVVRDAGRLAGVRGVTDHGTVSEARARVVVGADGGRSTIARWVEAPVYDAVPPYSFAAYAYWSDVEVDTAEIVSRPGRTLIAAPTHDGLTLAIVYWPEAEFDAVHHDLEHAFGAALALAPSLAGRIGAGRRAERFRLATDLGGFFRRPYGPGWALVGDAGLRQHPVTAEGITDAFRDAELLAEALDAGLAGRAPPERALAEYERRRNEAARPIYELTREFARLEAPAPEMQRALVGMRGDEAEVGRFLGTLAGTVPVAEFFAPAHLQALAARAG